MGSTDKMATNHMATGDKMADDHMSDHAMAMKVAEMCKAHPKSKLSIILKDLL